MTPDPSSGQPDTPGSKTHEPVDVSEHVGAAGVSSNVESPGTAIRHARERTRIGIEELAAQTKLARNTLEALEADDFEQLSEAVYVQGYYRKCAKVLGLSDTDLIDAYRRMAHPVKLRTPSKLLLAGESSELIRGDGGHGGAWWIVLVVVIVIAVAVWFAQRYISARNASAVGVTDTPEQVLTPSQVSQSGPEASPADNADMAAASASPGASGAGAATEGVAQGHAGLTTKLGAVAGETAASDAAEADAAEAPAGQTGETAVAATSTELVLKFTGTSWVRINDSTGNLLLSGVIQAGHEKVLDGVPPYALFLGNAPGVEVRYQGKLLSIASLVQSNSTARFSVPMAH